ncbi:MAG TPA: branched-chain amino acid ABC transporter permease [Nitrolancea sp.]|nr:branched-chain amino acid ABC transporter permease [Nitrolancea sp.]
MNLLIFALALVLAIVAARPQLAPGLRRAGLVLLLAVMLAAPFISQSPAPLFDALTAMTVAYGWNFIGGYTGYPSFGNVAFLGLGAYIAAGFMSRQPHHPHLPWYAGIPLGVILTTLAAVLIGLVVLRLRGHYFAIATLGVAVAMPQLINWSGLFGQFFGGGLPLNFPLVRGASLFGLTLSADRFFYYLALGSALLSLGLTAWLSRSRFGYSLIAIRENEEAAEVMGINTTVAKVMAYALSAALAALGGAIIGFRLTNMTTENSAIFNPINNLQMIIIVLIGGVATIWGPWIGAVILFGIQELIQTAAGGILDWQGVIFALIIIVVVIFLPAGLMEFVRSRARFSWRLLAHNIAEHRV